MPGRSDAGCGPERLSQRPAGVIRYATDLVDGGGTFGLRGWGTVVGLDGVGEALVMADVSGGGAEELNGGAAGTVSVGEDGLVLFGCATGDDGGEREKAGGSEGGVANRAG